MRPKTTITVIPQPQTGEPPEPPIPQGALLDELDQPLLDENDIVLTDETGA